MWGLISAGKCWAGGRRAASVRHKLMMSMFFVKKNKNLVALTSSYSTTSFCFIFCWRAIVAGIFLDLPVWFDLCCRLAAPLYAYLSQRWNEKHRFAPEGTIRGSKGHTEALWKFHSSTDQNFFLAVWSCLQISQLWYYWTALVSVRDALFETLPAECRSWEELSLKYQSIIKVVFLAMVLKSLFVDCDQPADGFNEPSKQR